MISLRDAGSLLQRAGLALPVADSDRLTVWYETPLHLMRDLRAMGETNILRDRRRAPLGRRVLARAAELYAERFARADGRVRATVEIVYLTGWAPADSQQKPLRPGSAAARLATRWASRSARPAKRPASNQTLRRRAALPPRVNALSQRHTYLVAEGAMLDRPAKTASPTRRRPTRQ